MVRIWGTEDKGLRSDRVLGGGSSIGHPESQVMWVKAKSGYVCCLGSGVQWGAYTPACLSIRAVGSPRRAQEVFCMLCVDKAWGSGNRSGVRI